MVSCKSHLCGTVSSRLLWAASLTVLGKGGELKNWMLEQPVKTKGCSSIQFLLREFCWYLNYVRKTYKISAEIWFFKNMKKYIVATNCILFPKWKKLKYLIYSNVFKSTQWLICQWPSCKALGFCGSSYPPRAAYCNSIYKKIL